MIIDSHAHMITANIAKSMGIDPERVQPMKELAKHSVEENTKTWLTAMGKFEIEKTIFMATSSLNPDFIKFINSSNRLVGFARINPSLPDSIQTLQKEFESGMEGVKLYPTSEGFDVSCKECYPFYEYCEKNKIPIVIHFGVTIGRKADLQKGNPLLLSKAIRDFPGLNFIIAHFGAGFFREVLMLKYKTDNLFIETSGTNNWLPYQDNFLTLKDIFKKSIEVFTPQGVIYGSDTRIFPEGYRENILKQQKGILNELKLSQSDKEDIMYNNAKRILLRDS